MEDMAVKTEMKETATAEPEIMKETENTIFSKKLMKTVKQQVKLPCDLFSL